MKHLMLLSLLALTLLAVVVPIAEAQTGGVIRDLQNEAVIRQNFRNALNVGSVASAFTLTNDSVRVYVPGVVASQSICQAVPYGFALSDSSSALYTYVRDNDSVTVFRNGTLKESGLKFLLRVLKY